MDRDHEPDEIEVDIAVTGSPAQLAEYLKSLIPPRPKYRRVHMKPVRNGAGEIVAYENLLEPYGLHEVIRREDGKTVPGKRIE